MRVNNIIEWVKAMDGFVRCSVSMTRSDSTDIVGCVLVVDMAIVFRSVVLMGCRYCKCSCTIQQCTLNGSLSL